MHFFAPGLIKSDTRLCREQTRTCYREIDFSFFDFVKDPIVEDIDPLVRRRLWDFILDVKRNIQRRGSMRKPIIIRDYSGFIQIGIRVLPLYLPVFAISRNSLTRSVSVRSEKSMSLMRLLLNSIRTTYCWYRRWRGLRRADHPERKAPWRLARISFQVWRKALVSSFRAKLVRLNPCDPCHSACV